ncbi:MAG: SMP-30/gluconolactonase/LRE family protein [Gemmatimonadaceae bacterium]|nr:SMP-30/gluconolactonase/LRE family protein [Gemmatimonadaceae bacterium]
MRVEQVTDPIVVHGEGPVWSPRWGGLRWVDMLAGDILSLAADGTVSRVHAGEIAAAIRPRRAGGAVIGIERGFALESADGRITQLPPIWSDPGVRMNEGGCDPDGRFYCGSMAYDKRPGGGSLYRLDPDGTTTVVLPDVTISNGLEWSADGTTAYYADTATQRIDRFDYDPARGLTGRRPFVDLDELRPDGLTVDADGGVWVALSNGQAVRRYTAAGRLDLEIPIPVRKVTACTFGGEALDQLYLTTSRDGIPRGEDPLAGSLFRVDVGQRGVPVREFAG